MDIAALLKRQAGKAAEDAVARKLRRQGWEILERNARCKLGEVDIIARDADTIVFVEVRSRREDSPVLPRDTITRAKQQRLLRLAEFYLREKRWSGQRVRVDVAEVQLTKAGKPGAITLLKAAIGAQ